MKYYLLGSGDWAWCAQVLRVRVPRHQLFPADGRVPRRPDSPGRRYQGAPPSGPYQGHLHQNQSSEQHGCNGICLVYGPDMCEQQPDIYRCIRSSRDRLCFMPKFNFFQQCITVHHRRRSVSGKCKGQGQGFI